MDTLGNNKKALDENSNTVQTMDNNGKAKKKKPRADRKVTILNSEQVEGHRFVVVVVRDYDSALTFQRCLRSRRNFEWVFRASIEITITNCKVVGVVLLVARDWLLACVFFLRASRGIKKKLGET